MENGLVKENTKMTKYTHTGKTGGRFYVIEGPDGVGKTTISAKVAGELSKTRQIILTNDPSSNLPISSIVRNYTKTHNITDEQRAILFQAARTELCIEQIIPSLKQGKTIICDRFYHSMIAYQSFTLDEGWLWDLALTTPAHPDHLFIVMDSWEVIKSRVGEGRDLLEKEDYLRNAYNAYKSTADGGDDEEASIIDGSDIDSAVKAILSKIHELEENSNKRGT